ncbi:hypothetical protein VOLCADRAFT_87808 [Volvox carteri f. nagariensis]|uniref:Uncharacterized protein n=1 Tax=Volvox carteri f. nagariensis TaxID=3068 RepID=D8TMA9_VOLCA|nr:uncharacterized protein VOLCADRAFT_87808 [Volvox carteri f. nagariensis]EFJ51610.1 hypothetical protein VOLCADRAFT_87808 [Volvox carteri f. nagariensis]|eukprot:XP_002947562.1 hypothetical protein VOLCADRAFT_87808 [Volvox carteri f. nagariensis]
MTVIGRDASPVGHRALLTTPTRFEDPLLSMPSFRRSGGSPTLDSASGSHTGNAAPVTTSALVLSPALRAGGGGGLSSTNSFSARCNHFIDFRRSLPGGGSPGATGQGDGAPTLPAMSRPTSARQPTLSAGNSYFGNLDYNMGYASSITGSESGGPGLDDDEVIGPPINADAAAAAAAAAATVAAAGSQTDGGGHSPVSSLLQARSAPSRRHSAFTMRSPPGASSPPSLTPTSSTVLALSRVGGISPPARLASRSSEGDELVNFGLLQQNYQLQQQQHYGAGSTSFRDRQRGGSYGHAGHFGGPGGSLSPCEGGLQNQTHAVLEQLRGELKSLSMRSLPVCGSGGAAAVAATGAGTAASSSGGGGAANNGGHVVTLMSHGSGGGAGRGGSPGPGSGRVSDGQPPQVSPPRLFLNRTNHSIGSGGAGSDAGVAAGSGGGDHGGGAAPEAPPELFPPRQISSYNCTEARTQAVAVQRSIRGDEEAEQEAF